MSGGPSRGSSLIAGRFARGITRWASGSADVPPAEQNAWQRGAADTRRIANDHAVVFSLLCAAPGGAVAVLATILAADEQLSNVVDDMA